MPSLPTLLSLACVAAICAPAAAQTRPSAVMMRYPDVSQHAVVFRYAGDLWVVDKDGGEARRMTSASSAESFPKFSPDGTELAFMASYDAGSDLYVMPVEGGVPRRVTYHPATEVLCDWHPDGERLLFFSSQASGQARAPKLFLVPAVGGAPAPLPLPYGTFGSIEAAGDRLAYTPTSREFRTWKRYRGGLAQDVWIFNLATKASERITDEPGTDAMPMWHGSEVVFLSDRGEPGRLNLFAHDVETGETRRLTSFEQADVRFPSMGPEDVVFENDGKLFRFNFPSDEVVPVEVIIPGDRPDLRTREHAVQHLARDLQPGPGARRVVLEARGDVYTVPVEEGFVRNLTASAGVAERSPRWSPDGRWVAYVSDRSGEYELTLRRADGEAFEGADEDGERQLTRLGAGWKSSVRWSPDARRISFATSDGGLYVIEVESATLHRVTTNPSGEPLDADWSPDSAWLAWSHRHSESRLDAIYLYDVTSRRAHEVTSGMFDDSEPCFGPDGEWLYFHSSRSFEASAADLDTTWIYADTRNLMAVPLRAGTQVPWGPRNDEEEVREAPGAAAGSDSSGSSSLPDGSTEGDEPPGPARPPAVAIDLEGFEARAQLLPLPRGRFAGLRRVRDGLIYLRLPRAGSVAQEEGAGARLLLLDAAAREAEEREREVLAGVQAFEPSADGRHVLVKLAGAWYRIEAAADQETEEPVDLSGLRTRIEPRAEWAQLVTDTWRLYRDFFYDPQLHGVDWGAVRERTRIALDDATSREDVDFLLGEMIAELNVGHAYYRPARGAEEAQEAPTAGLLGCDWILADGAYRIGRILAGGAYDADTRSPLAASGVDVRPGDYLLAVNGRPVDPQRDVHAAFLGTAGVPTQLTLCESPQADGSEREVLVQPLADEAELRYRDWVRRKREHVAQASGGRIGYVHVPDTGARGQAELMRQFLGQMHERALVIDERWNAGGQVPTRFIELLDRPLTNFFAVRDGEDLDWPPVGHRGPKAMLINHASGSGGDALPYYFRQAQLGPLIGTRTWGGLVGLSDNPPLIDGALTTVPRFAFYELDGTWGVEGHGVEPDIVVEDDPARMQHGEDPQLDAAIEHLQAELERWPFVRKTRPPAPDRSGSGIPVRDR